MQKGVVTKKGTKVPLLSTKKISKMAEVNPKQVSKSFDRMRTKGFIINDDSGDLGGLTCFIFHTLPTGISYRYFH